tara:strand:+ start:1094 stop:2932 length:1839 start_codon:yes stop_codon:yes gene_type:complete
MCGFVAIISKEIINKNVSQTFNQLVKINKHRGPDKIKSFNEKKYSIVFRRLSIIDLSNDADQPFFSEDKKIKIIFNGEIYNYLELRDILKSKGLNFKTKSDTEVILKAYQTWGVNFIIKLRGMFSIVIFDDLKHDVYLFRDHLGQKPLYYSYINNLLVLSSEIKDILFLARKNKFNLNDNNISINKYLIRGWCDDNNQTFYENIFSFPAGSYGKLNNQKIKIKKYWNLEIKDQIDFDKKKFERKFEENIKLHLRADVPIAFTLSGGFDSSSIVSTCLKLNYDNIKTFSLKFRNNNNDEKSYIDSFIKNKNLNHEYVCVENSYHENILEEMISFQDEPIGSISFLNQFILRKKIHENGFKVLMEGEGGDEVLGGYNRMFVPYIYENFYLKKKSLPKEFVDNLKMCTGSSDNNINFMIKDFINLKKKKNDIEMKEVFKFLEYSSEEIPKNLSFYNETVPNKKNTFKNFLLNHLYKRDLPHILRQEDRNSMRFSIENRSPFVDSRFVEFVFSHKNEYFMKNGLSKYMLREIMKDKLPKEYFKKRKIGRPGNPNFLINKFYYEKFIDLLNTYKIPLMVNAKIKKAFIKDHNDENNNNYIMYFRFLNYLIWKDLKKI